MKTYVWALYASLLLYSCGANSTNRQDNKEDASTEQTQKAKKKQGLVTLDVTKDYPEKKIVLQDLADVKYIPLETKKNALLTNSTAMLGYVSDSLIVAFTLEKRLFSLMGTAVCVPASVMPDKAAKNIRISSEWLWIPKHRKYSS